MATVGPTPDVSPVWIGFPGWGLQVLLATLIGLYLMATVGHGLRSKYRRIYGWRSLFSSAQIALLSIPNWIYQLVMLTLLLLPWWWISVLVTGMLDRGPGWDLSPTRFFLGGLIALHVVHLLVLFLGPGPNRRFRHRQTSDAEPAAARRVAVVGAGMAGLVAAKELREEGHDVVVFERTAGWGGVWAESKQRGGRAWATTMTSTGALNTTLSDSPFPIYFETNGDTPLHFTRQQFLDMLTDYEARYRVFDQVLRTETEVTAAEPTSSGWVVRSRHRPTGTDTDELFDAVTLCTGLNHDPWTPDLPGADSFHGTALHVDAIDPTALDSYAGQRVLIVGLGETAADLANDLTDAGVGELVVAPRGSTVTLARNFGSVPPDYNENRVVYYGPMFNRWGILLTGLPIMVSNLIKPSRVRSPSLGNWLRMFRPHLTGSDFPSVMGSANATKSDHLWRLLDAGRATMIKPVAALTTDGVELTDGSRRSVDTIVYCTGYRTRNPTLPPIGDTDSPHLSARDLYKLTIHPRHPTLAVIGYARGMIGAITLSTELQARWWALLVSGKRTLPDQAAMSAQAGRLSRRSRRFSQATRTTLTFASSVARNDIGCEPDMVDLFLHRRDLWWRLLNGPICSAHYRLHGTGAKPELASQQLTMPGSLQSEHYVTAVDVAYNVIPLAAVTQPMWAVLERVLPIPSTRRALDTYI